MARIVVLFLLGLGIYLFIRQYSRSSQNSTSSRPATTSHNTVQCIQCKTYVPQDEAIKQNGQVFCCKQHARDWIPPG